MSGIAQINAGSLIDEVIPFRRIVGPDDKIASKIAIDRAWIEHHRDMEQPT